MVNRQVAMLTTERITKYNTLQTTLVLIAILKAKRVTKKKFISPLEVLNIYIEMCQVEDTVKLRRNFMESLKKLNLAGFIKTMDTKTGITITEVGFGENTPEVMENLIYQDSRFTQYKDYMPAI
jgi:hypothetical protein